MTFSGLVPAQRREPARRPAVAAVADLTPGDLLLVLDRLTATLVATVALLAPVVPAPVDDDLHVGVVLVVVDKLVVELVLEWLRHDAVDHGAEPTSALSRPASSAAAFQSRSSSSSSPISSPFSSSAS